MACIYMRGGTWHIYYFYGGKRYRYSLETDNERAARSELKRIEGEIVTGKHQVPKRTPLDEFLRSYLAHLLGNISHGSDFPVIGSQEEALLNQAHESPRRCTRFFIQAVDARKEGADHGV